MLNLIHSSSFFFIDIPTLPFSDKDMKYKDLIERFKGYEDEDVSIVIGHLDCVSFFPASDGNKEIISLASEREEPFKAFEVCL